MTVLQQSVNNAQQHLRTLREDHIVHFAYWAEETNYFKPKLVNETKTTAIVESRTINVQEPGSHERRPYSKETSYSAELNLAYDVKYHTVDAWISTRRTRIIRDFNTSATSAYEVGGIQTSSAFPGTGRLILAYNGRKSRGVMQDRNRRTGIIRNSGLEKDGDAIRFYVHNPQMAWFIPLKAYYQVLDKNGDHALRIGKSTYKLRQKDGYAVGAVRQETSDGTKETIYSNFAPVKGSTLPFPRKIEVIRRDPDGNVRQKAIAHLRSIEFVPEDSISPDTFELQFPVGTDFSEMPLLRGALMGGR